MDDKFKVGTPILEVSDTFGCKIQENLENICVITKINHKGLEAVSIETSKFKYGNYDTACFRKVKLKELSFQQIIRYKNIKIGG